jgi:hypothetical protein
LKHAWYRPTRLTTIGRQLLLEDNPLPKGMMVLGAFFLDDYRLPSQPEPSYDQQWYYVGSNTQLRHFMTMFADFIGKDPATLYFYYRNMQIDPMRTCTEVHLSIYEERRN